MSRSLARASIALAGTMFAVACSDNAPTSFKTPAQNPSYAISDAANGGNAHFFWWEPIVPAHGAFSGVFNGLLYPTLEICNGTSTTNGHCTSLLASFTRQNGMFLTQDQQGNPLYKVEWTTSGLPLGTTSTYRLVVLLGDFVAGYADATRGPNGNWTGSSGNLIGGPNTLPIPFRLEEGVVCGAGIECLETMVTDTGGTFTLSDSSAGAYFPPNALTQPVNLIIEQSPQPCLPTTLQQYPDCMHYSTEPAVPQFGDSVTVGICMTDPNGWNYLQDGQLRLWKWSEITGDPLVELNRTAVDFLSCPDFSTLGSRTNSPLLRGLARAGHMLWSPFAKLVGPKDAYALITYEGGKLSNFSRIGWVRPLMLNTVSGDNQQGYAGYPLPLNPTVRVTNKYGNTAQPVPGVTVNFLSAPGGSANPSAVNSDAFGLAATTWTLGSTTGAYTLTAGVNTSLPIAPAPYEPTAVFNATAVDQILVKWLPPLLSGSTVTGTYMGGLSPVVRITQGTTLLAQRNAVEMTGYYQANWNIPSPLTAKTMRVAAFVLGVQRGYVDLYVDANGDLRNVSTGDKVLNLKNSRTLPVKFVLYR